MAKPMKRPAPKVAKGGKGEKTSTKKTKAAKAPKFDFALSEEVTFLGYGEEVPENEQVFEAGDRLVIKGLPEGGGDAYVAVKKDDSEAFDKNPDSVDGGEVAAHEIKKAGKAKAEKQVATPLKVVSVGDLNKIIKKNGDDPLVAAKHVFEDAKKNFFYFGGLMAKIYNENLNAPKGITWLDAKNGGKEAWEAFCEENFNWKSAQVRAYMDIYTTISAIPGADIKRVADIGWSKMAEVSRYVTPDNYEELVELADKTGIRELKTELKTTYLDEDGKTPSGRVTRGGDRIKMTNYNFGLFEDQAASVNYILAEAQKQLGHDNVSQTFEYILTEWAADHLDAKKVKQAANASKKVRKDLKNRGVSIPAKAAAHAAA